MYALAKLGFNQSYNYFPWRNSKAELTAYFTELSQPPVKDIFRANLWPNTPDILPYSLQNRGWPSFVIRLLLAATLGSSYGIYGPAFELIENQPLQAGSEEYLNSEKYEIRDWDFNRPDNLTSLVSRLNHIRRENPAMHRLDRLHFHPIENEALVVYSKTSEDLGNVILTVVNLDPDRAQSGWVNLALDRLGLGGDAAFEVHDLLTGGRYRWHGSWNYVELKPWESAAHIFQVRPVS
jgi:starch synthase (maltosyl-transferring)